MAEGAAEGIAVGLGEGLNTIANQMRYNQQQKVAARDKQADDLTLQIKSIADNIAKVGGKDAPEAQPLIDQLNTAVNAHNALFQTHESPALIQRLQKMMGHKPGAPQQDPRAQVTPAGAMAAAPMPANPILNEVTNLTQVYYKANPELGMDKARELAMKEIAKKYHTADTFKDATGEAGKPFKAADGKWYQEQVDDQGNTRKMPMPEGYSPDEGWKQLEGQAGQAFKGTDGKMYITQVNKAGKTRTVEAEGMTDSAMGHKPLEIKTNTLSDALQSVTDPNSGKVYTESDIPTAPPEIQKIWGDVSGQVKTEQKRKIDLENKKIQEAEDRQNRTIAAEYERQKRAFDNNLAEKKYGIAEKDLNDADKNYRDSIDRMRTMDKNLDDAMKGDQQAMLSLAANHIGMTLGYQKGARITRASFDEAVASRPWLSGITARWDADGYLSGVVLTDNQMQQMVRLAREKVDTLKQHRDELQNDYHDALNPRPAASTAVSSTSPAAGGKKPSNADEYLKSIGHH
jgi:hypothetical protein